MADNRLEHPQKARRREQRELARARRRLMLRRMTQAVVSAAVLLILVVVGIELRNFVRTTPHLGLKTLEVKGLSRAKEWEVKALGELSLGTNLFSIDLNEASHKIARHPWIASVTLRRSLPGTLVVEVVERQPVALLPVGDLYYVDTAGEIFKKVKPGDPLNLPVLSGFDQPGPLQKGPIGRQGIKEALGLLEHLTSKTHLTQEVISEVHLDPDLGFSVYMANASTQIHLGWENFDQKLVRLVQLLEKERLDLTQVKRIDMDLSKWAVVTPM